MGKETLGRIINVIGEPVDEQGPVSACLNLLCESRAVHVLDVATRTSRWLRQPDRMWCVQAEAKMTLGIHREAPPFVEQSTAQEILVTGIKVPRLLFSCAWAAQSACSSKRDWNLGGG